MDRRTPGLLPVTSSEGCVYLLSILCLALAWFSAHAVRRLPFRHPGDFALILGAVLAFAGFCNAVIGYHGDLWEVSEMARHAWLGSTFLRLGAGVICFRAISLITSRAYGTGDV